MKTLKFLLLFSILFNVVHISYINLTSTHSCKHENKIVQKLELPQDNCGDLCDMHHICCFHAIMPFNVVVFDNIIHYSTITAKKIYYSSTFQKTLTKPPIS